MANGRPPSFQPPDRIGRSCVGPYGGTGAGAGSGAGLASARARGRKGGREPKSDLRQTPSGGGCYGRKPETNVGSLCAELGITRSTLYRHGSPTGEVRGSAARLPIAVDKTMPLPGWSLMVAVRVKQHARRRSCEVCFREEELIVDIGRWGAGPPPTRFERGIIESFEPERRGEIERQPVHVTQRFMRSAHLGSSTYCNDY